MSVVKPATNRWYVVSDKRDGARCLVEANAPGQALRRAAAHYCNVKIATVADTIDMIRNECDVISAQSTPEQLDIEDVPGVMPESTGKEDGTPAENPPAPLTPAQLSALRQAEEDKITAVTEGRAGSVFEHLTFEDHFDEG